MPWWQKDEGVGLKWYEVSLETSVQEVCVVGGSFIEGIAFMQKHDLVPAPTAVLVAFLDQHAIVVASQDVAMLAIRR